MLVRLSSGEQFPMICRKITEGIYPVHQSVFVEQSGVERWHIMCEPRVGNSYTMTRLELSRVDGVLFMYGRRLKSYGKIPLLSESSL